MLYLSAEHVVMTYVERQLVRCVFAAGSSGRRVKNAVLLQESLHMTVWQRLWGAISAQIAYVRQYLKVTSSGLWNGGHPLEVGLLCY